MARSEEQNSSTQPRDEESEDLIPFLDHLLKYPPIIFMLIGMLLVVAVLFPYKLTPPSSPVIEAEEIGPAWYFNWVYMLLRYAPNYLPADLVRAGTPYFLMGVVGILFLLPFLDRNESLHMKDRRVLLLIVILAMVSFAVLTILPYFLH